MEIRTVGPAFHPCRSVRKSDHAPRHPPGLACGAAVAAEQAHLYLLIDYRNIHPCKEAGAFALCMPVFACPHICGSAGWRGGPCLSALHHPRAQAQTRQLSRVQGPWTGRRSCTSPCLVMLSPGRLSPVWTTRYVLYSNSCSQTSTLLAHINPAQSEQSRRCTRCACLHALCSVHLLRCCGTPMSRAAAL